MSTIRVLLPLLSAAALLAACGRSEPPAEPAPAPGTSPEPTAAAAAEAPVLNVYNWSDYVAEDTIERFEKETGIDVTYDVYDNNEVLEAKLMAGSSGYDVVFPSARPYAQRHIQAGLYLPLDKSKLTNWTNLDPAILKSLEDVDPGNEHLMPYMWGTTGLGLNVAQVAQRLGEGAAPDSWALLFDPALAAKLKDCGISVLDDEQEGFGAAAIHAGRDPNEPGQATIDAVSAVFAEARPNIRYFHSSKYIDDLANGEICLAMGYNGDVLQARDRAAEAKNGVEIAFIIPKEGALRWVDNAAIPKDAPHPGNAHRFLDFLMRPDVIGPITNFVSYANANAKARDQVDPEISSDPGIYPPDDVAAKLVDPKTLGDEETRARVRAWTSIKSGQ